MTAREDDDREALVEALRPIRRRVLDGPACPRALLRRVQGLWDLRPMPGLLPLVFDSWADVAPALRGTSRSRSLRFEAGDKGLDVRITRASDGGRRVQIAVDPPGEGLTATVQAVGSRRGRRLALSPDGVGQAPLGPTWESVYVVVHRGREEVLRSPPVALE